MAIYLVTYDLRNPGRDYTPVHNYLKRFVHCKGMESVWLLQAPDGSEKGIRDALNALIDRNDRSFVTRLYPREWASYGYSCGDWLNDPSRAW